MTAIVVLGSANLDLVVRQPRLPEPGETLAASGFTTAPGGKGLNQAVAAARAGGDVAFLGAVGRDALGTELRATLVAEGIDVSGLVEVDAPTGTAHIAVLDDGENAIVVVPGANAAVTELDERSRAAIAGARFLVTQLERPLPLVHEARRVARASGATTVLTPAPARELARDVLVPNAGEVRRLAGVADERDAALTLSTAGTVVLTRGAAGVLVARDGAVVAEASAPSVAAVDTTGAGDCLAGVLVARLSLGDPLEAALEVAVRAAAISVTRPGAASSMPRAADLAAG